MSKPKTIAFIHEDKSAGVSLVRMAQSAEFHAKLYESVDRFLAAASDSEASCVVLDASIPNDRAFALLDLLNATEGPRTSVILLSKTDEPELRQRARDLGAVGYFREPVDGEALLDAIRWLLCESSATDDSGNAKR